LTDDEYTIYELEFQNFQTIFGLDWICFSKLFSGSKNFSEITGLIKTH